MAVRREQGGHIGRVGYGYKLARNASGVVVEVPDPDHPLEPIVAAVREAGSILGGAKLLQDRNVPTPDGKSVWGSTTLRRIIEREAAELIPRAGPTGRRQPSRSSVLAQLLVCHCGKREDPPRDRVLTPEPARHAYRCRLGVRLGRERHGPMWVAESSLLPWVKAEAGRLRLPKTVQDAADNASLRAKLAARVERANDLYIAGRIDRARYDREAAVVADELDRLGQSAAIFETPSIDWDWPAADVNAHLRLIFDGIELDERMRPERVVRRLPAEYWA